MNNYVKLFTVLVITMFVMFLLGFPNIVKAKLSDVDRVKLARCQWNNDFDKKIYTYNDEEFKKYLIKEDMALGQIYERTFPIRHNGQVIGPERTYKINKVTWIHWCVAVWGGPEAVPASVGQVWQRYGCPTCQTYPTNIGGNSTVNGGRLMYQPKYLGFNKFGYLVPNPEFPFVFDGDRAFMKNKKIVDIRKSGLCPVEPNGTIVNTPARQSLINQANTRLVAKPSCTSYRFNDDLRGRIIDDFYLQSIKYTERLPNHYNWNDITKYIPENLDGYFDHVNIQKGEPILSWSPNARDDNINKYADFVSEPEDWSYGTFLMWHRVGIPASRVDNPNETGGQWWYFVQRIFPSKCPSDVCGKPKNASVKFAENNPTKVKMNQETEFTWRVQNQFPDLAITAPCLQNPPEGYAQCLKENGDNSLGYIRMEHVETGDVKTVSFEYDIEKEDEETKNTYLDISKNLIFDKGGTWKLRVQIPMYKDEFPYTDNHDEMTVEIDYEDALIQNLSKTVYTKDEELLLAFKIKNEMSDVIGSSDQTVEVINGIDNSTTKFFIEVRKKATGEVVFTEEKSFSVKPGESYQMTVSPNLDSGRYVAHARIPWYMDENKPVKYHNNSLTFEFEVERSCLPKPKPPENLVCKGYDIPYIQNLSEGLPKGPTKENENEGKIIKMCVGMYPNHPSTTTEGGQGTYFVVNYRFFPMPIPPYQMRTIDQFDEGKGYCQVYINTELNNGLGEDDAGEIDSFIYYPVDDNIGSSNYKNLPKPYIVGPHSFKHYKYRGRMMAREVDFKFEIIGPDGETTEARGEITYKIPDKCYIGLQEHPDGTRDQGIIDFRQAQDYDDPTELEEYGHCREVYFYLPIDNSGPFTPPEDLEEIQEIPDADERIHFRNPGIYTFKFEAVEKQEYRYQEDLGKEFQGKVGNSGLTNKGLPREGITNPSEIGTKYINQRLVEITIDKEIGQTPKDTTIDGGGTPNEEYQNHCYLEEDGFDKRAFDGKDVDPNGDPKGFGLPEELNAKLRDDGKYICFHDHSIDYHYWLYDWSEPKWYEDGPIESQREKIPENYGLNATYFHNPPGPSPSFGTPVLQRIDGNVNFNWGSGSPHPSVPHDHFGVRWTGYIYAPVTGTYTFRTDSDDGIRLWVNNSLIVNKWIQQSIASHSGTIHLQGGKWYPFKMEMYENTGVAASYLNWSYPGNTTPHIIPAEYFGTTMPD